jgi:hypothetical protein
MTLSSLISRVEEGSELASASVRPEPSGLYAPDGYWSRPLVDRLRERASVARSEGTGTATGDAVHFEEAAHEIDRLTRAADAGMGAIASLAAAVSLLERTPRAKKAAASDRMFDLMLDDYRKALEAARAIFSDTSALENGSAGLADAHKKDRP